MEEKNSFGHTHQKNFFVTLGFLLTLCPLFRSLDEVQILDRLGLIGKLGYEDWIEAFYDQ